MTTNLTSNAAVRQAESDNSPDLLTLALKEKLSHPATSPDFDFVYAVNQVLSDVGMTIDDCGGTLSFYGQDPIVPSPLRYGAMAGVGLAARSVALAALWKQTMEKGRIFRSM
ncbi:MAG: hypothetical protein WDM87_03790 [Terracidiphilus sp.]